MRTEADGTKIYSWFEVEMMQLYFHLYGGTTEPWEDQPRWKDVQRLKRLAQVKEGGEG
jgi:hypothetical protein